MQLLDILACIVQKLQIFCLIRDEPLMIWGGGGAREKACREKNSTATCVEKKLN